MSKPLGSHLLICLFAIAQGQPGHTESPNTSSRTDLFGDPLPAGAEVRFGTVRWRHGEAIVFVAFLPDGKTVLTTSQDQIIRLWDLKTGKESRRFGEPSALALQGAGPFGITGRRFRFDGPTVDAFHAVLSADGKLLATCGEDGAIRLWDVGSGKEIGKIVVPGLNLGGMPIGAIPGLTGVASLALSPDGKAVAATAQDRTIYLWESATGKESRHIGPPENQNLPLAISNFDGVTFSPDGKTLLATSTDIDKGSFSGAIRAWDVATGKKRFENNQKGFGTLTAVFSPDSKKLAYTGLGWSIRILNAETGEQLQKWMMLFFSGRMIFSPDSKTLITEDPTDHSVRVWDVLTGKESSTLVKPSRNNFLSSHGSLNPAGLAFSRDGKVLAIARDHALRLLDANSGKELFPTEGNWATVSKAVFLPDGKSLITQCVDGSVRVWGVASGTERRQIPLPLEPGITALDISRDGQMLATGTMLNRIALWDAATGKRLHVITGEKTGFSAFALSPDKNILAVREMISPSVHLYDTNKGKEIRILNGPAKAADANPAFLLFKSGQSLGLVFSPDGKRLAAAIDEKTLGIWDTSLGKQVGQVELSDSSPVQAVTFSPDNRTLAVAREDDCITLWEIATGQARRYLGEKPKIAENSPKLPAMGLAAGLAGVRMPVISNYNQSAASLVFSPNGKIICQARSDYSIALWDPANGQELDRLHGHQGEVSYLTFAPDGKRLASASSDTTTVIWDLNSLFMRLKDPKADLSDREIEARWGDLVGTDAAKAYESVSLLSAAPDSTLVFLRKHLKPAQVVASERIDKLIKELDDKQFDVREKASRELGQLGELALPSAQKAFREKPSPEMRRRLQQFLSSVEGRGNISDDRLRTIRATEVLERIGTPEARQLLQLLANGAPGALQTEEAKESLQRLRNDRISGKKPR